jgi:hypothetical protein
MMQAATKRQRRDAQSVIGASVPAPTKGWNAKDALADMKPDYAVQLDNWIPRPGYVEIRRGFKGHVVETDYERVTEDGADVRVTEAGDIRVIEADVTDALTVESLIVYSSGSGADKVFAASGQYIFDVTTAGTLGAPVESSKTNARWQDTSFSNDGGIWTLAFNGADTPIIYDGTNWADTSFSGSSGSLTLTPSTLIDCVVHKRRLMMVERESLRIWFPAIEAISGACELLDLGPVFDRGGTIACIGTWTLDGGAGADDMLICVTNQGQVAVYQGIDPADANNWSLVGVYEIGMPLGRRAMLKYGAELVILTSDGAIPLSQALKLNRSQQKNIAITADIQNAFALAARSYAENFGWEGVLYPAGQLAIFNVPITSGGIANQYVQNVQTGAWCKFLGLNAICWAYANDTLYFGGNHGVYEWDTGGSDNGTAITCDITTAFNGFSATHRQKQFTMARPILRARRTLIYALDMLTDYRTKIPSNTPSNDATTAGSGQWGTGQWGTAQWTLGQPLRLGWASLTGLGYVGAVRMRVVANPAAVAGVYPEVKAQFIGADVMYQPGGML